MRFMLLLVVWGLSTSVKAELKIPAATAYLEPDGNGARVSDRGISRWVDTDTSIIWYGNFKQKGEVSVQLEADLPEGTTAKLRLTVEHRDADDQTGQSRDVTVAGDGPTTIDFGTFNVARPGYLSFCLKSLEDVPQGSRIQTLLLNGTPTQGAHFNLKPRRNAASVHLSYPVESSARVSAFYCEMTAVEDPIWSYYMACGWHRGYFGMQVNSPTERRIIFSVWDSGNEGIDRDKVADANRVTLVNKGEDVYSGDFGNEGTGGHSHLKFQWKTGEKQRFLVTAEPVSETQTVYSGYYFRPDQNKWMLISSWKAPKEGGYMKGLYSFSENFVGRNGNVLRKALYGNQWIRRADGTWQEITTAKFSHDVTGRADRMDRLMGLEDGQFYLAHGGFTEGLTKFGTPFIRPTSKDMPQQMNLPGLPAVK